MSPMPYGHVSADRLGEAAQTASLDGLRESERRHVKGCQKCRSLFAGYRMADRLLAASWRQTTLPASALVNEPARRRLMNALGGFAAGFEFRRFAPAAIAILLVAAIGFAFALPQLIPATRPSASPTLPLGTRSASPSPSATVSQASPQPSASASAPEGGPSASPAAQQSGGGGGATPQPQTTATATPGSAVSSGPIGPMQVASLSGWPIAWAPDGRHMLLAQVTAGRQGSRIQIRDAAGRVTGSASGTAAVWVDSNTVAIATAGAGQANHFVGGSTIALVDVTGHETAALPGQYANPDATGGLDGGVLVGSGSGQLAVVGQSGPNFSGATYVTWNGHAVSGSNQGVPIAFSQDGTKLAVIHPVYGSGGSLGGNLMGSLEVVSVPGSQSVASFPHLRIWARSGVQPDYPDAAFSPNGSSLLISGTLVDLTTGTSVPVGNGGWLPDGTLVTVSNGQLMRWQGTHAAPDTRFPGGGVVETSGRGDIVEYFADGRPPVLLGSDGTLSQLSVPGVANIKVLIISPDGRSVALEGHAPGGTTVTIVATIG